MKDKLFLLAITFIVLLGNTKISAQVLDRNFHQIYQLIDQKNFFEAQSFYQTNKSTLSLSHQKFIEICLDNAFGRLNDSNNKIERLMQEKVYKLPDSLQMTVLLIKEDNSVKLYDYKEAKKTTESLLSKYANSLTEDKLNEYRNNLKIWTAIEHQPKQKVVIKGESKLKLTKDKAGLNNLPVSAGKDTIDFIFDTGANFSTISKSAAKHLKMNIIPGAVEVSSITGNEVYAQLAVCPELAIGDITIHHAVFLVLEDDELSFPQIEYQIHGILGFPVIEALKEIRLTRDGYLIVPERETAFKELSNMAMDGLTPLILIDGRHFTFDTGASNTVLYSPYFIEHRKIIESKHQETSISLGGAGGVKQFSGFHIDVNFNVDGKSILLKDLAVLKNNVEAEKKTIYGNIGQDFIKQFDEIIINFHHMFIKFGSSI